MNKFDLKTAKFIGIVLFICLIFALVVMKAYQYLPEENLNKNFQEEIQDDDILYKNINNRDNSEINNEQENTNETKEKFSNTISEEKRSIRELENIEELDSQKDFSNNDYSAIELANKYKQSGEFKNAIEQYNEAANVSDEKNKAYCYEQIATIHAIEKHYGTALSFAQKAYNTYPNTSREMLLARLYYKTGNIDKATNRMNNILKRDFEQDR